MEHEPLRSRDPLSAIPPPWSGIRLRRTGATRTVPTMLSWDERQLYVWLGEASHSGAGAIVDLGCFLGGSTAHLAEGTRRAGRQAAIHAFDRFRVTGKARRAHLGETGAQGRNTLPLVRRNLEPWADRITLHKGAVERQRWDGTPIEILVVDVCKTAALADRVAATFYPHVLPGRGLVVHQDALHWKQPWIVAQMEWLSPCLTPVAFVPPTTLVYRCTAPVTRDRLHAARLSRRSDAAILAALAEASARLEDRAPEGRVQALATALLRHPGTRAAKDFPARLRTDRADGRTGPPAASRA